MIIWYMGLLAKVFLLLFLTSSAWAQGSAPTQPDQTLQGAPLPDEFNRQREMMRYQIAVSTKTAERVQEIYDQFTNSFLDYESAITKMNILINEYNKAIQLIPAPLTTDGEVLHELVKKLLSRVDQYFSYYKKAGREDPVINYQVFEITFEISKEAMRLRDIYGI